MYTVYIDGILAHDPAESDPEKLLQGAQIKKSVNTADSFTFTIYPSNPAYNAMKKLTSVVTVKKDDAILFHGRVLSDPSGWNNEKDVTCEGDLAYFCDTIIEPYSYSGTVLGFVQKLVNEHNAQTTADKQITIRTVTVTDPNDYITRSNQEYSTTMQEILGKLPGSALGGYIRTEYDEEEGKIFLDYLADSTDATNQRVTLAENLLDFQRLSKGEGIITALIPLGARDETTGERLTIESVNGGLKYITDAAAVQKYGLIYGTETWDDVTVPANLLAKAQARLTDLSAIIDTITVKAVDLSLSDPEIEGLGFFQYVTLQDTAHNASGQFLITERTFSLSNPQNDTLTFGGKVPTISGQTTKSLQQGEKIRNETTELVEYMTGLLTGSKGGYKVEILNEDGLPEKTLYMDTQDVETARQVLMISKDGIGFSTTGINGPYTTAWTIGGDFNADFIKAGVLQGIRIIAEEGLIGGWSILEEALSKSGSYDVTGVTAITASYIASYLLGHTDLETAIANGADINGDGRVDYLDQALCVFIMLNELAKSGTFTAQATTENGFSSFSTIVDGKTVFAGGVHGVYGLNGSFENIRWFHGASGKGGAINSSGIVADIEDASNTYIGRASIGSDGVTFLGSNGTVKARYPSHFSGVAQGYTRIAYNTSNSYNMTSVSNLGDYQAFVLVATRGIGKGVMEAVTIPKAIATQCTSDATCSWVYSAQNGAYSGQCYFDFTNNRVYLKSSGNADCRVELYGFAI